MSTMMGRTERVEAARQWFDEANGSLGLLAWEDVELVVELGVTDAGVARNLLLASPDALFSSWSNLQGVFAAWGDAREASETRSHSVEDRQKILTEWHARALGAGRDRDLAGLGEADLRRIAVSGAVTAEALRKLHAVSAPKMVSRHADEIAAVLSGLPTETAVGEQTETVVPAARPAPAAEPTLVPRPETAADPEEQQTNWSDFEPFDYATVREDTSAPHGISFMTAGDERIEMTWPGVDAGADVVLYRVMASDEYPPIASTDLGDLIAVTTQSNAVDTRGFDAPVRHVAVWANRGKTEAEARRAQPTLVAADGCVLPVRLCEVREDEGTVIGQWKPLNGVVRVDVLRSKAQVAKQTSLYDPNCRLRPDQVGLGGFTDRDAKPGEEYEYRIYVVARVTGDSEEMSEPVARRVRVRAVVHAVDDLRVTLSHDRANSYDLRWSMPPNGNVEIYRSEQRPVAGLGQEALARSAIVNAGLTARDKLINPLEQIASEGLMRDVTWPSRWARAYFTPVTVLDEEQIRVGKTRILTRTRPVSEVRLIERVDSQFLTFAWPSGVTSVKIFTGPQDAELLSPETEQPIMELSEDEYRKYGGAHLLNTLPVAGCAVHLVGTTYSAGRAELAKAVSLQYAGLARIRYRIETPAQDRGRRFGRKEPTRPSRLMARCDAPITGIALVLVHNLHRLPLFIADGLELTRIAAAFEVDVPKEILPDMGGRPNTGFIRLFADVPPDTGRPVAVLDPSIDQLRCK